MERVGYVIPVLFLLSLMALPQLGHAITSISDVMYSCDYVNILGSTVDNTRCFNLYNFNPITIDSRKFLYTIDQEYYSPSLPTKVVLFRSTDNGLTWTREYNSTPDFSYITPYFYSVLDENDILNIWYAKSYAGSYSQIYYQYFNTSNLTMSSPKLAFNGNTVGYYYPIVGAFENNGRNQTVIIRSGQDIFDEGFFRITTDNYGDTFFNQSLLGTAFTQNTKSAAVTNDKTTFTLFQTQEGINQWVVTRYELNSTNYYNPTVGAPYYSTFFPYPYSTSGYYNLANANSTDAITDTNSRVWSTVVDVKSDRSGGFVTTNTSKLGWDFATFQLQFVGANATKIRLYNDVQTNKIFATFYDPQTTQCGVAAATKNQFGSGYNWSGFYEFPSSPCFNIVGIKNNFNSSNINYFPVTMIIGNSPLTSNFYNLTFDSVPLSTLGINNVFVNTNATVPAGIQGIVDAGLVGDVTTGTYVFGMFVLFVLVGAVFIYGGFEMGIVAFISLSIVESIIGLLPIYLLIPVIVVIALTITMYLRRQFFGEGAK